ncbi:MAG: DUF1553 domain-containing protein [Phycisphaera sp.]|nr:DUF1553 domain-containing protein [Phycisphaera sp.]
MSAGKTRFVAGPIAAMLLTAVLTPWTLADSPVDRLIAQDNADKTDVTVAPVIDDMAFLRRATLDLIGRIPTSQEVNAYLAMPSGERRGKTVDRLLNDPRFADRWTVFFADMLRIRSNADGGTAELAYVNKAIADGKPYDELARELISANGRANKAPAVGFILGDNADPMALAGNVSQTFMGIRIACAQCHDHPFDDWEQKQFYGLAAYFGKTRRVESELAKTVYTTETREQRVQWPPERQKPKTREPVAPVFPFRLEDNYTGDKPPSHIARLIALRAKQERDRLASTKSKTDSLDALIDSAEPTLGSKPKTLDVAGESRQEARALNVEGDLYKASELRSELARLVTDPRNRYFSRSFVNRMWKELVGTGFIEPVDDFSDYNKPVHPKVMDWLADEFVASGYDLRSLIRTITATQAYQRGHLPAGLTEAKRREAHMAFTATPLRRMVSEVLYDCVVVAGHLEEQKWPAGANLKTITQRVRMVEMIDRTTGEATKVASGGPAGANLAMAGKPKMMAVSGGYDLESSIEVDFNAVLKKAMEADDGAPMLDKMKAMSPEQMEAMQMTGGDPTKRRRVTYKDVSIEVDDNPQYTSAMRMATPAQPSHFLRIFGQPARDQLGEKREYAPSMRQELLMLNGKLTHEASRVGILEPMYKLLDGPKPKVDDAIRLAYREILTREPSESEMSDAREIVAGEGKPLEGMADLRWALLNCHEFRYIP